MTTNSNVLGTSPPTPSTPPITISADSPNEDVKLWVYHCLKKNDTYLNDNEAWALARQVKGIGQVALYYSQEDWEKQVPGWGGTIYISLQQSQKYVMDRIFELCLAAQALLLLVAGGSGALQFFKKDFKQTKTIGLVFIIYTFFLGVLRSISSSKWAHENKKFPGFLKLRRRGDQSFWKDFAGIPR